LDWGNNLPGMSEQETERCQLLGRQMNHSLSAKERSIGFKPETCEKEFRFTIPRAMREYRGSGVSGARRLRRGRFYPIQYRSLRLPVNHLAVELPFALSDWQIPAVIARESARWTIQGMECAAAPTKSRFCMGPVSLGHRLIMHLSKG
jgi:hypothetical protein